MNLKHSCEPIKFKTRFAYISNRILTKMIIVFLLLIIIPVSIIGYISTGITSNALISETVNSISLSTMQMSNYFDTVIKKIEETTKKIYVDVDIQKYAVNYNNGLKQNLFSEELYANRSIDNIIVANSFISGFVIILDDGSVIGRPYFYYDKDKLKTYSWYKKINEANGKLIWFDKRETSFNNKIINAARVGRVLKTTKDNKACGIMLMDIKYEAFSTVLAKTKIGKNDAAYLMTQQGNVISSKGKNESEKIEDKPFVKKVAEFMNGNSSGLFQIEEDGKSYCVSYYKSEDNGWISITKIPLEEVTAVAGTIQSKVLLFGIIFAIIAVIIAVFFSLDMSNAIKRVRNAMAASEKGDMTMLPELYRGDEIGNLAKSYNNLIIGFKSISRQLEESMNNEYLVQLNKRKIEMKMLQSQINPHFLYNTLNVISAIAELNEVPEICTAANALSDLFRYNIKGKEVVKVKDEIQQIENYMGIQKLRFPGKLTVEYAIDENLMEYLILKLTLQPIIENSVYHGIETKKGHGYIKITALKNEGILDIIITDNGVGMDEKKISELNKSLNASDEQKSVDEDTENLGLKNVNFRIRSYYGSQYGLRVQANEVEGISVHVIIPYIYEEAENGENFNR